MKYVKIVFSPTGGTAKVADILTKKWTGVEQIDLSKADTNFSEYKFEPEDNVLIAMPSFGGLAPEVAINRLKKISGNGAKCTIVCVYGNRAYEDTLAQMEDAAKECGFEVIAAVAAIAEHSIIHKYATNRPDAADEKQLEDFAEQISNKEGAVTFVPGNRPYKKSGGAGLVPKVTGNCVKCGLCASNCPVKAIDTKKYKADSKACISCMRCISECPHHARKVNGVMVGIAGIAIKNACSVRKENELFL
nr:4Fe-4S binding protein [uncultured Blautia sp.]